MKVLNVFGSVLLVASLSFAVASCDKDSRLSIDEPVDNNLGAEDFASLCDAVSEVKSSTDKILNKDIVKAMIAVIKGVDFKTLIDIDQITYWSNGFRLDYGDSYYSKYEFISSSPVKVTAVFGNDNVIYAQGQFGIALNDQKELIFSAYITADNTTTIDINYNINSEQFIDSWISYNNNITNFFIEDLESLSYYMEIIDKNYESYSYDSFSAGVWSDLFNQKFHKIDSSDHALLAGQPFYTKVDVRDRSNATVWYYYGTEKLSLDQVNELKSGLLIESITDLQKWFPVSN